MSVPDHDLRGFLDKRIPSRDKIIDLDGLGIALIEDGDDFGHVLRKLSDDLLDIRVAIRGGARDPKARHFA